MSKNTLIIEIPQHGLDAATDASLTTTVGSVQSRIADGGTVQLLVPHFDDGLAVQSARSLVDHLRSNADFPEFYILLEPFSVTKQLCVSLAATPPAPTAILGSSNKKKNNNNNNNNNNSTAAIPSSVGDNVLETAWQSAVWALGPPAFAPPPPPPPPPSYAAESSSPSGSSLLGNCNNNDNATTTTTQIMSARVTGRVMSWLADKHCGFISIVGQQERYGTTVWVGEAALLREQPLLPVAVPSVGDDVEFEPVVHGNNKQLRAFHVTLRGGVKFPPAAGPLQTPVPVQAAVANPETPASTTGADLMTTDTSSSSCTTTSLSESRMQGTIYTWNPAKGYGFISAPDHLIQYFAHLAMLVPEVPQVTPAHPLGGTAVEFTPQPDGNKWKATSVTLAGGRPFPCPVPAQAATTTTTTTNSEKRASSSTAVQQPTSAVAVPSSSVVSLLSAPTTSNSTTVTSSGSNNSGSLVVSASLATLLQTVCRGHGLPLVKRQEASSSGSGTGGGGGSLELSLAAGHESQLEQVIVDVKQSFVDRASGQRRGRDDERPLQRQRQQRRRGSSSRSGSYSDDYEKKRHDGSKNTNTNSNNTNTTNDTVSSFPPCMLFPPPIRSGFMLLLPQGRPPRAPEASCLSYPPPNKAPKHP